MKNNFRPFVVYIILIGFFTWINIQAFINPAATWVIFLGAPLYINIFLAITLKPILNGCREFFEEVIRVDYKYIRTMLILLAIILSNLYSIYFVGSLWLVR